MWLRRKPRGNLLIFYHITFSRILTSLLAMTTLICSKMKSILTWRWISYAKYWRKKPICSANVTSLLHQILFQLTSMSPHVSAVLSSDSEFYYLKNVSIYVWYFTKLYALPLLKKNKKTPCPVIAAVFAQRWHVTETQTRQISELMECSRTLRKTYCQCKAWIMSKHSSDCIWPRG